MALLTREQVLAGQAAQEEIPSPDALGGINGSLRIIPDGRGGIAATLDSMVAAAHAARFDYTFRKLAETIIARVPSKQYLGEAEAVQEWVRSNIRYTADPVYAEMVKEPREILNSLSGDCDDHALLVGILMQSIGYPVRFKAVAIQVPGEYEHVYAEAKVGRRWVAMETTEPVSLGWEPPYVGPPMVRNV